VISHGYEELSALRAYRGAGIDPFGFSKECQREEILRESHDLGLSDIAMSCRDSAYVTDGANR
jgi:hypothetical protein